jgi:hypothetical protein
MNLNNKFGECCSCPALISDGRLFTSYVPRKDFNNQLMKQIKVTNNNDYREFLQNNGDKIIASIQETLDSSIKCADTKNVRFNQSIDIDAFFNEQLQKELAVKYNLN